MIPSAKTTTWDLFQGGKNLERFQTVCFCHVVCLSFLHESVEASCVLYLEMLAPTIVSVALNHVGFSGEVVSDQTRKMAIPRTTKLRSARHISSPFAIIGQIHSL